MGKPLIKVATMDQTCVIQVKASAPLNGSIGWAAIIQHPAWRTEIAGVVTADEGVSRNRATLVAITEALQVAQKTSPPGHVLVETDIQYIADGYTKSLDKWVRQGWKRKRNGRSAHVDLWEKIVHARSTHPLTIAWVGGFSKCRDLLLAAEESRDGKHMKRPLFGSLRTASPDMPPFDVTDEEWAAMDAEIEQSILDSPLFPDDDTDCPIPVPERYGEFDVANELKTPAMLGAFLKAAIQSQHPASIANACVVAARAQRIHHMQQGMDYSMLEAAMIEAFSVVNPVKEQRDEPAEPELKRTHRPSRLDYPGFSRMDLSRGMATPESQKVYMEHAFATGDYDEIVDSLELILKARSMAVLAEHAGLDVQHIYDVTTGASIVPRQQLLELTRALGVDVDDVPITGHDYD